MLVPPNFITSKPFTIEAPYSRVQSCFRDLF
jgi:hypothetical protein